MDDKSNFNLVSEQMIGRLAMSGEDARLIEKYAALSDSWMEIGTLWGGSAILAALANPRLSVICIDPMTGYYGEQDSWIPDERAPQGLRKPSTKTLRANLVLFGIEDRVRLIERSSIPWPAAGLRVDGILIDGDHSPEVVREDIRNAQKTASKFILCHDTDDGNVNKAVEETIGTWREIDRSARMRVFAR